MTTEPTYAITITATSADGQQMELVRAVAPPEVAGGILRAVANGIDPPKPVLRQPRSLADQVEAIKNADPRRGGVR